MAKRRRGHFGAWRALCALPAWCGSLMVLAITFGWLGVWANLVLAGWLMAAAVLLRRRVERVAVFLIYGYRRPRAGEAATLAQLQEQALRRCGLPAAAIDWYVHRSARGVTGYAAGGWSVAVSAGLLEVYRGGRLSEPQAVAILTHELAHHLDRSTRYGLAVGWLTAPWRVAAAVVGAPMLGLMRVLPGGRAGLVLLPVVGAVAVVQLVQQGLWLSAAMLVGLALVAWVHPLADAALSRASERAADAYAARLGVGADLAQALASFHAGDAPGRWRASHPPLASRLDRLAVEPSADDGTGVAAFS